MLLEYYSIEKGNQTYHHIFTEKTLLLLQALLHSRWRKFAVSHMLRVLTTVNETIDVYLQLNKKLEK